MSTKPPPGAYVPLPGATEFGSHPCDNFVLAHFKRARVYFSRRRIDPVNPRRGRRRRGCWVEPRKWRNGRMMPACDPEVVRADQRGNGCIQGKPWLRGKAVRQAGKRGTGRFRRANCFRNGGATPDSVPHAALQRKRQERLLITTKIQAHGRGRCGRNPNRKDPTNWNHSGKRCGQAGAVQQGSKRNEISRPGHHAATERCKRRAPRRPIVDACRSLLIPSSDGLGRARPAGPAIVNACRSLLIPRRHFGAAGGAGVFAFGAGRFLPLAGSVGSSCA